MTSGARLLKSEAQVNGAFPDNATEEKAASWLLSARRTVETEITGMRALHAALGNGLGVPFTEAVRILSGITGRVIVTGIGKSGHIGCKLAATFASTGTPAQFVHATEASHGDLGMITPNDAILALSWSGETQELGSIINYSKRFRVPLVSITSRADSALGKASTVVIKLPKVDEACPHGLAPTTSTVLQLSVGDALAVALLEARGFTAADFKIFHPGGKLGATLQYVRDVMHGRERMPVAPIGTRMDEAILIISGKGFGCLGVVDEVGNLIGMITDGDLRRHLSQNLLSQKVEDVMSINPRVLRPDVMASEALERLNANAVNAIFVVEDRRPIGILNVHDLLRVGVA